MLLIQTHTPLVLTNDFSLWPLCTGFIAESMSWEWCFYFPAIFLAITAVLLFFFLDESMYDRELLARQALTRGATNQVSTPEQPRPMIDEKHTIPDDTTSNSETSQLVYETQSYWKSRKLFTIVPGKPNRVMHHVLGPLTHLYNFPIMSMSGFQYGAFLS